ncbi:sensor histidine kinase [Flexivirga meconopsidis]|uniref:sensor histidine kinase n=1 Tax=Flexivirga meconopsidis TaxID=2977121 RepID=UPI00223FD165
MNHTAGRPLIALTHWVSILLSVPTLAFLALTVVGIVASPVGIGVLLLLVAVPALQLVATGQRALARAVLREPVVQEYAGAKGLGPIARVQRWATDPTRWRDLLWALYSVSIGHFLSMLSFSLLVYPLWSVVWYFLWLGLPDVFGTPFGVLHIHTTGQALVFTAVNIVLSSALWWYAAKPLARWRFGVDAYLLGPSRQVRLQRRVDEVTISRARGADAAAAELRRIERDLHDGAQARLVALGMNLGLAAELVDGDPEGARQLLLEARDNAGDALQDIRSVVRGIHPPVLADRGVVDAIRALAVDLPVDFELQLEAPDLPAPMESAIYFGVAECLANIGKHSRATAAWVTMQPRNDLIHIEIGDNGIGGASTEGSGLRGVASRVAVFDGTMSVSSPTGGPTVVNLEVPCVR